MTLRFSWRFLGPIRFMEDGHPMDSFRSRKAVALLGYLAVQGTETARPHLADLLWPGLSEPRALANLSWIIAHINRRLPGCLRGDRTTVFFHPPSAIEIDVVTFRSLLARNTPDALAAAVELYRGELMQGFYINSCPEFETWLLGERAYWQQQVSQTLAMLIQHAVERQEYRQALSYAQQLLKIDPYREDTHRTIMHLLALSGQRHAALAHYVACRQLLHVDLNIDPAPETVALYDHIREGSELGDLPVGARLTTQPHLFSSAAEHREAQALLVHSWSQLPTPYTSFVGREEILAKLSACLHAPTSRLITLIGPGGIGKTRLALHLAEQQRGLFRDGVCIVPLASITTSHGISGAIAQALDLSWGEQADLNAFLLRALANKEILLILDNFEHLLDGNVLLLNLLHHAPFIKILVTSRERLHLQSEQVFLLPGLGVPQDEDQEDPIEASAVRLFLDRAHQGNASLQISDDQLPAVAQICRLLDGNPLAIELAAVWAEHLSPTAIAEIIQTDLDRLVTTLHDVPERHRSMRTVFMESWKLLSGHEQRVLARLSVFRGSFDQNTAQVVAEASWSTLIALEQKSLLQRVSVGAYQLHEVVRFYAAEQLRRTYNDYEATMARHYHHYLGLVEVAEHQLQSAEQASWLQQLDHAYSNIQVALQWCLDSKKAELGIRLAGSLGQYWRSRSAFVEGERWLKPLLNTPAMMPARVRAKALTVAGNLAMRRGDYAAGQGLYEEGLALYRQIDDLSGTAAALINLGMLSFFQGVFERTDQCAREALALYQRGNHRWGIVAALGTLAMLAAEMEEYAHAQRLYAEAEALLRELGNTEVYGVQQINRGLVYLLQGQYDQAAVLFETSLQLMRGLDCLYGEGEALRHLGMLALCRADLPAAWSYYLASLRIAIDLDAQEGIVECVQGLAATQVHSNPQRAARWCAAAAELRTTIGAGLCLGERKCYEQLVGQLQSILSPEEFAVLVSQGKTMTLKVLLDDVLTTIQADPMGAPEPSHNGHGALWRGNQRQRSKCAA